MAAPYLSSINPASTPQTEPLPGETQVQNNAGGFIYQITPWQQLERFLILGTVGGTYYVQERPLTQENAAIVRTCLDEDAPRTLAMIRDISVQGRAQKNDPAILALALAAAHPSREVRREAFALLPVVCRIPTHLMHFAAYVNAVRGWGRGLRQVVTQWYTAMEPTKLAYAVTKYQQRDGWSNRDLLRLCHAKADGVTNSILRWIVKGDIPTEPEARIIEGMAKAQEATTAREWVALIADYRLEREMLPTSALTHARVWEALLPHMPMTAMLRNLGTMSKTGFLAEMSNAARFIAAQLTSLDRLRHARIHPLSLLVGLKTYVQGHGMRSDAQWPVVRQIVDALDTAFYLSFQTVQPTGKRLLLALDISGSMGAALNGLPISCREATAALALVTANVESQYQIVGFTRGLIPLTISPRQRLDDVVRTISDLPYGDTDCALPMLYAQHYQLKIDMFSIYTDNETWAGQVHPMVSLWQYRNRTNPTAKLATIGMTSTGFSIAAPDDPGAIDVVGFDTGTPSMLSQFAAS